MLLEYSVTNKGTYVFLITRSGFKLARSPATTEILDRLTSEYISGLRTKAPVEEVNQKALQLNDYLIKEGGHVGYGIRPARQRQGYGRLILALALDECRSIGLARVLVTCLQDNVASARIIEANGGELENVIADPASRGPLRRYWIAL